MTDNVPESPVILVSETAVLDQVGADDELWAIFPGEELHWDVENWADDAVEVNAVPWWMMSLWLVYLVWGVFYIFYGATQW